MYRDMRSRGITGLHSTREGNLYISANTPHFWAALCELIGLPQLATDPRYDSVRKRAGHGDDLLPQIRSALAARSAIEWEELFGERVPCSAVRVIEDMFDHLQVLAEGMVATYEHPLVGRYRGLSRAVGFGNGPPPQPRAAPALAQHSDEVLARHGYREAEIAQLRQKGVIA